VTWPLFWKIVLLTAFFSYFTLAIVLTIGGFFDVKTMFRRLAEAAVTAVAEKVKSVDEKSDVSPGEQAEPPAPTDQDSPC
jgi:hypothetical protein